MSELKKPIEWNGYHRVLSNLKFDEQKETTFLCKLYCPRFSVCVYFYVPECVHEILVEQKGDYWGTGDYSVWIENTAMQWVEQYCYNENIFNWHVQIGVLDKAELDDEDGKRHETEGNLTFGRFYGTGHDLVEDEDELAMVATLQLHTIENF